MVNGLFAAYIVSTTYSLSLKELEIGIVQKFIRSLVICL